MTAPPSRPVWRVLTRNLYLGADVVRLVAATSPEALAAEADALLDTVRATAFEVRVRMLAAEVVESRADVVGVQEAALWRSGPPGSSAELVVADHLAMLVEALAATSCPFDVVAVQDAADVGVPTPSGTARLTMRDAVLVRRGSGTVVRATSRGRYRSRLEIPVAGRPATFERGWATADLSTPVGPVRVVATHLDSLDPGLALAQAEELLEVLGEGPVVVLLDANSGPPPADPAAWALVTGSGLVDAWAAVRPGDPGPTCGLSETLTDADWSGLRTRIDHVLVRGLDVLDATRTGTDRRDAATGLWASDHAGVLAVLAVPD